MQRKRESNPRREIGRRTRWPLSHEALLAPGKNIRYKNKTRFFVGWCQFSSSHIFCGSDNSPDCAGAAERTCIECSLHRLFHFLPLAKAACEPQNNSKLRSAYARTRYRRPFQVLDQNSFQYLAPTLTWIDTTPRLGGRYKRFSPDKEIAAVSEHMRYSRLLSR